MNLKTAKKKVVYRCTEAWSIDWPGHSAALRHVRCKNRTRHDSGKCYRHRSNV